MAISRFLLLFLLFSLFGFALAEIRFTEIRSDDRPIIPFEEFGYTRTGRLELEVSRIALSDPDPDLYLFKVGFFLCTRDAWMHVLQQLEDGVVTCALYSDLVRPIVTFELLNGFSPEKKSINGTSSLGIRYQQNDADQYTLLFANCLRQVKVSMNVRSEMYNLDGKKNQQDYLSVGKTILPDVYFPLSFVYFTLVGIWTYVLYKRRVTVVRIHFLMLAMVILKAFNLLCEAEDKSYIKRSGSAHVWDVLFYVFSFLKGITLLTQIVLIATGVWSFLKPYKEKKVWMIVIPLHVQVVTNIGQVVLDEVGPFGLDWVIWKTVFLLVDVVCCFAVLFLIGWWIKNLREATGTDEKAELNLKELNLFRQYYSVAIFYIYFTRFLVTVLETFTCYKYFWTSVVAGELVTLAFYVFTGYNFKPEAHNPYSVINDDEPEAAA